MIGGKDLWDQYKNFKIHLQDLEQWIKCKAGKKRKKHYSRMGWNSI